MRRIDLKKAKTQVARSSTIRNINKQIVLNYIREREPISRAEIARETALQRSTVSAIVDALVADGFIKETGAGESTGGRKPTMLQLRTDEAMAIGVDITPTATTVATANLAGEILEKDSFATSPDREKTFEQIVCHLKKFKKKLKNAEIEIGVSVPGLVNAGSGVVTYVPFFHWENWNLKHQIQTAIGLPAVIDNDANATALAELWFGKPEVEGVKNFVSVLVAEGIGTGIIFDGQIYRGNKGAAGEFGHMVIGAEEASPTTCSCGSNYCWEAFASNTAAENLYAILKKKSAKIDEIFQLASAGDETALRVLNQTTRYLALGIVNLIVGLSPGAVVINGKLALYWSLINEQLLSIIEANIQQKIPAIKITASTLGEEPTLIGAVSLSLIKKFASAT